MFLHIPIVILASTNVTFVADSVPKFDIARECRSEGGSQVVQDKCAADEVEARDDLGQIWTKMKAGDRALCVRETSMDGTPSYVELLTCLEIAANSKKQKSSLYFDANGLAVTIADEQLPTINAINGKISRHRVDGRLDQQAPTY